MFPLIALSKFQGHVQFAHKKNKHPGFKATTWLEGQFGGEGGVGYWEGVRRGGQMGEQAARHHIYARTQAHVSSNRLGARECKHTDSEVAD